MIDKEKIIGIVNEYLGDGEQFLIEVKVSSRNKVSVFIDGDNGVQISDCAALSRHIETFFDREKEDFELDVSSVGIGTPLQTTRQFYNNCGRMISLIIKDEKTLKGRLSNVQEGGIFVEAQIIKKGKKRKNPLTDSENPVFVSFADITEAKIVPLY